MGGQHFVSLNCTEVSPTCPVEDSIYGYSPSLGINSFFVTMFGILALTHGMLGVQHRTYFLSSMLTAGSIAECIGYAGRILLHANAYNATAFSMQVSCLIFAPSFIAAGVYITLKQVVERFGAGPSALQPPVLYTWVFISCDIMCLVLQAVGGGMAGGAGADASKRDLGTDLMIAGIVMQVATLLTFAALVLVYMFRLRRTWHLVPQAVQETARTRRFKGFVVGSTTAYVTIGARCVYRIPELADGWANPIMSDEVSFIVLEGL